MRERFSGKRRFLSDEPYGQSAFAETDVDLLYVEYPGLDLLKSRLPSVATDLHRILSQPAGGADFQAGAPATAQRRPSGRRAGQYSTEAT